MSTNSANAGQSASLTMAFGLPDDRLVRLTGISDRGVPELGIPGSLALLPYLPEAMRAGMRRVLVPPDGAMAWPGDASAIVNCITDPDVCALALARLATAVDSTGARCFNHPHAVQACTRDGVASALAGIEGLCVPQILRLALSEPDDLAREMQRAGLEFPVIVRIAGSHGGSTTRRIDSAGELRAVLASIPWGGRSIYVTQYVPYRSDDGLHRKMRLVVVGDEVHLRHLVASDGWHVHADDRDANTAAAEQHALANFTGGLLPVLRSRVLRIAEALQLDYFGIDCTLLRDGRLLVFEANPAMNVLLNTMPRPNYWDPVVERITASIAALLADPTRWRRLRGGGH